MAEKKSVSTVDMGLLEKEYFYLQNIVKDYDDKALTIKTWSVSIAGTIAGSSAFTVSKEVLLFASLVSFMFWLVEGSWKSFQRSHYDRIDAIESFMRGKKGANETNNFQISKFWVESYMSKYRKSLPELLIATHVFVPHGAFFVLLLLAYLLF